MSQSYIEFRNVSYRYPNGHEALRDVSFRISYGEKVALLGKNGAGKSTLLLLSDGLILPTEGTIDVGGTLITKKTLDVVRQTVGLVFQNPDDQLFMPTVEEDVAFGPLNMKLSQDEVKTRVEEALRLVGCEDLGKRSPNALSGGQRRRVAVATVLSMDPSVLVLDEPSSNLDWGARAHLIRLLGGFKHTCIVATHDLGLIRQLCPRTIVIDSGRIIGDGPTDEIFADTAILKALDIPDDILANPEMFPG